MAHCPVCGKECASEHGVKVHRGLVHKDGPEQATVPVENVGELTELLAVGRLIDKAYARLSGEAVDETVTSTDPEKVREHVADKAARLKVEVDKRIPKEGYRPQRIDENDRSYQ